MGDIYCKKLNWPAIMDDIRNAGCSVYRAAKTLGRPETTVWSWTRGVEPTYSNGAALLQLHAKYCGEDATKKRCTEEVVNTHEEKVVASTSPSPETV